MTHNQNGVSEDFCLHCTVEHSEHQNMFKY